MATAAQTQRRPVRPVRPEVKATLFVWEGTDRAGKKVRGEMRAATEAVVSNSLRRQSIKVLKIKKQTFKGGGSIKEKEIALFTRQLATMTRAGVPLLQSFDIAARSTGNNRLSRLLLEIKGDIESGNSLAASFKRHPMQFDELFCNLVGAGEQAGILDSILDRLAVYKEKTLALKGQIKAALFYPAIVIVIATIVVAIIMWFVIPSFKTVFANFGADLPWLTNVVVDMSDWFVKYWYVVAVIPVAAFIIIAYCWKRFAGFKHAVDRISLKLPVVGEILEKAAVARWTRTLATMFAAGVPLVDALTAVGGASGNQVFLEATKRIQTNVATGTALTVAMEDTNVFPNMALQMTRIGEETGALDSMLSKVADFYEREVDDAVSALSSLIEPIMIVFLGVVIGTIVVAMYLPIFKLGAVV